MKKNLNLKLDIRKSFFSVRMVAQHPGAVEGMDVALRKMVDG